MGASWRPSPSALPGYQIYGLNLESSEALEGLRPSPPGGVDVHLHWPGGRPPPIAIRWDPPGPSSSETPAMFQSRGRHPDGTFVRLRFTGRGYVDFTLDPSAAHLWIRWTDGGATAGEVRALLLGTVIGHVLRLRGVLCLHASAVTIGDAAIALVGPKGAGKSTLAAALAAEGHRLLTDDIAALHESGPDFVVPPGQTRTRLRPDAAEALCGSTASLAEVGLETGKHFVDLTGDASALSWRLENRSVPLRVLYVLDRRPAERAPVRVEPLSPGRGAGAVLAHAHARLDGSRSAMTAELERLGRLVARVPVRRLDVPGDLARLAEVRRALLRDAQEVLDGS